MGSPSQGFEGNGRTQKECSDFSCNKIQDEVPTKKALENYNDFGLDQSISDYPDNQSLIMGAVKEAFIKSFKHKMDFDISTPHGFLAFTNKKFNQGQSPNPAERNIVFPANRG